MDIFRWNGPVLAVKQMGNIISEPFLQMTSSYRSLYVDQVQKELHFPQQLVDNNCSNCNLNGRIKTICTRQR